MTPEKEKASKKFIDFLLSPHAQKKAMELGLRPIDKNLQLASPFDEEHGVDARVQADRVFQVPDEGVLKRVRDLWEDAKIPATTVLILDRSGSMKGKPMDSAKEGAIQFVQSMRHRDQVEVIIFSNNITVLAELCSIKDCGENVIDRLRGVFAEGGTALHDVVARSYKRLLDMEKQNPRRRYGIVVLTDGKDTSSSMTRQDLMDSLPRGEDFDVPKIYSIAYGSDADRDLLAEISNRTNARLFTSSADKISATYKELSANF